MDDIGNIIYILFLLISLLGGLWGNVRKKQREAQQSIPHEPVKPRPQSPVFSSEELKKMTRQKQVQRQQAEQRLQQLEKESALAKEGRLRSERRRSRRREAFPSQLEEQTSNDFITEIDLTEFDARKAIIYSEILKPPYL